MSITKLFPSGAWEISAVIKGYRFQRVYMGYTKKEAIAEFRVGRRAA